MLMVFVIIFSYNVVAYLNQENGEIVLFITSVLMFLVFVWSSCVCWKSIYDCRVFVSQKTQWS